MVFKTSSNRLSTKLPPKSATGEQPEDPKTAMGGHPTRMVPRKGLEPSRPLSHWHLKPARLPIPPPGPGRVSTDRLGGCQIGEPCRKCAIQGRHVGVSRNRQILRATDRNFTRKLTPCPRIWTRWSRFSEDRVFSDDASCAHW